MFSLLIWACVATQPTDCAVFAVASGFSSAQACQANGELVAGWFALHTDRELREGTRAICTSNANYLLNRFKA
jgi:hypothetical protein